MKNGGDAGNPEGGCDGKANAGHTDADAKQWEDEQNEDSSKESLDEVIPDSVQMSRHAFADESCEMF